MSSIRICIHLWKQCVDRFRMRLKGKAVRLNGEATLLSRRIIYDTPVPCMVPLIGKAIARFNARANNTSMTDETYIAGKSLSYAYEFRHAPILRDAFMQRYENVDEDMRKLVVLDDLTWFTRSNNKTMAEIKYDITHSVTVDEWDFETWLMDTYEMGVNDLKELLHITVLNPCPELVDHPAVSKLSIDW